MTVFSALSATHVVTMLRIVAPGDINLTTKTKMVVKHMGAYTGDSSVILHMVNDTICNSD